MLDSASRGANAHPARASLIALGRVIFRQEAQFLAAWSSTAQLHNCSLVPQPPDFFSHDSIRFYEHSGYFSIVPPSHASVISRWHVSDVVVLYLHRTYECIQAVMHLCCMGVRQPCLDIQISKTAPFILWIVAHRLCHALLLHGHA